MWDVKLSLCPVGQAGQSESPFQHASNGERVSTLALDIAVAATFSNDATFADDVTTNGVDPERDSRIFSLAFAASYIPIVSK